MVEVVIETERLRLRTWRRGDLQALFAICNDSAVMRHIGPPESRQTVSDAIARQQRYQRDHGYCYWAMERRDDARLIGFCGLIPAPDGTPMAGQPDIGWRLAHDAWGHGYAREAAGACLYWGFAALLADTIWAVTVPANTRSWGLMERLGMMRRTDADFAHPRLAADDPLRAHIAYAADRSVGQ